MSCNSLCLKSFDEEFNSNAACGIMATCVRSVIKVYSHSKCLFILVYTGRRCKHCGQTQHVDFIESLIIPLNYYSFMCNMCGHLKPSSPRVIILSLTSY